MAEHSTISWTDATWPIVAGCDYVSPGCSNCWAVRDSWRLAHNPNPRVHNAYFGTVDKQDSGKLVWSGIVRPLWDRLAWPLKWRGHKRVFVCSQSDLFNPKVPFDFIAAAFGVMAACPNHTFQVLTKHAARMREFFAWAASQQNGASETCAWEARYIVGQGHASEPPAWPLENVWLGVTVEDQKRADERIPELLRTPAAVRWLSVEPMLEAIDVRKSLAMTSGTSCRDDDEPGPCDFCGFDAHACGEGLCGAGPDNGIHWVVCGGESAQTRATTRDFDIEWARSLRDQCAAADVPFFMKQLGTKPILHRESEGPVSDLPPAPPPGKSSRYKWHEPQHWPEDLRVQEFPA